MRYIPKPDDGKTRKVGHTRVWASVQQWKRDRRDVSKNGPGRTVRPRGIAYL